MGTFHLPLLPVTLSGATPTYDVIAATGQSMAEAATELTKAIGQYQATKNPKAQAISIAASVCCPLKQAGAGLEGPAGGGPPMHASHFLYALMMNP